MSEDPDIERDSKSNAWWILIIMSYLIVDACLGIVDRREIRHLERVVYELQTELKR